MNNNYNLNSNNKKVHQSKDIESQMQELTRMSPEVSLISSFTPEIGHNLNTNDQNLTRTRLPSVQMTKRISFYDQKLMVYNFLQRPPRGLISLGYHIFVTCVVFTCLVLTVFSTIADSANKALDYLKITDSFVLVFFSAEFIVRLWSSDCISHYRGWKGKLRFLRSPFRLIDIFIIYSTAVVLFFDDKSVLVSTSLRGIRFLQVFQVLKLDHRFSPWRMMASVVWDQKEHLAITTYMGSLALLIISFLVYFLEKGINPAFNSLASSLWWGVVTLCTIGYGDMYPITPFGKLLSCICSIIGVSIFALPAGILGTGLALKVQEQQRQRHLSKRRIPAATLIQCIWRYYVADKKSLSKITWRKASRGTLPKQKIHRSANPESNALKFVLAVKYFIARKKFSAAFKPYDIKDVLEQYAAGHIDMLSRVKQMESRMDTLQAVVSSNFKSLQDSKLVLLTRMSKVEDLLKDSQIRFNALMEMQNRSKFVIYSTLKEILNSNYRRNEFKDLFASNKISNGRRMSF